MVKKKESKNLSRKDLLRMVVHLQNDLQSAVWLIRHINSNQKIDVSDFEETLEKTSFDMSEKDDLR